MTPEDRIAELETLVAALREELWEQWEANHFEQCGRWPHPAGKSCMWPPPEILTPMSNDRHKDRTVTDATVDDYTVGKQYLLVDVQPRPTTITTPAGWTGTIHVQPQTVPIDIIVAGGGNT